MKCPHCDQELGLNNICINIICSFFGKEVNPAESTPSRSDDKNYNKKNILDTAHNQLNNHNNNFIQKAKVNTQNNNPINTNNFYNFKCISEVSNTEFTSFFSSYNSDYYLKYTENHKNNNHFLSWNWSAFFLTSYWFLYRKLYILGILYLIISISLTFILKGSASISILLILRILTGLYSNAIYFSHANRKILNIKSCVANLSDDQYLKELKRKGGVNLLLPLIAAIVVTFAICITILILVIIKSTSSPDFDYYTPIYNY